VTQLATLVSEPWPDYALLDSGGGRKLERYGRFRFIRPDSQALWKPASPDWAAHGEFVGGSDEAQVDAGDPGRSGRWRLDDVVPPAWPLGWSGVRFNASCTPFRHLGFFPDMAPQWAWMRERVRDASEVLNLFGYTGVASLALAHAGARVTHVDASKKAITAARDNQQLSGLQAQPIRWLVDDAGKFVAREARRGRRYDGIILDPPKFGRGPHQEVWKLEEGLPELLAGCRLLLDERSSFLVLTVYAIRMSALAIRELVAQTMAGLGGHVEAGEMTIREEARGLLLPTAIFVRWSAD
jgi:23S rRNA (cytosine1962-C5)-methyltransferase